MLNKQWLQQFLTDYAKFRGEEAFTYNPADELRLYKLAQRDAALELWALIDMVVKEENVAEINAKAAQSARDEFVRMK